MSTLTPQRMIAVVTCGLFFAVVVVLLLSDRSGVFVGVAKQAVIETGQQLERIFAINVIDRDDIPGSTDQLGHAALWGTGTMLVGWFVRHQVPVAATALLMAFTSLMFEISQPVLSTTRAFQHSDVIGNFAGVAAAALVLSVALRLVARPA